ncbi:ATP-dependent helicase hrpA [Klebsiella pneumoniae]|uniref:ATP-dependent helicase hrpA n=1 Tax=Klebsiella pneumoniae TaxID=573 RepID=A0A2X1QCE5_KLEPN|nr:ATP-dependent helicase hrpA [Klebsiella pneumoniae]
MKDALKGKVQETLSAVADDGIEQSGLHIWSFGTLAESYEQKRGNYKVKAWPALVDERDSVAIKLFDNPQEQQQAMWRGLRRLLLLKIPSPIKYLHEKLPNKAKLGLYFNPYGKVLDLIDDCISCGVDKLIDEAGGPVWTEEGFSQLHDKVRAELNDTVVEIAKQVEQILTAVFNINKRLKGRVDMTMALGLSDIKAADGGSGVSRLCHRATVSAVLAIRCAICRRLKSVWRRWLSIRTAIGRRCLRWRACSRRGSSG